MSHSIRTPITQNSLAGEGLVAHPEPHDTTQDASLTGCLFILVGPSGVGKNTIMRDVMQRVPGLRQLPTATTRPPRPEETEGVQHYFVSLDRFNEMWANGDLLEHQEVHPGKWYGVPRDLTRQALGAGTAMIADIDIYGAQALKAAFPDHVITIFVRPPSLDALRERLRERGENDLEDRFRRAEMELSRAAECDYQVVNDVLETCVSEVTAIVQRQLQRA
jgi:guanylate kinase